MTQAGNQGSAVSTEVLEPVGHRRREGIPRWIRHLALPISLGWIAITAILNIVIAQLAVDC